MGPSPSEASKRSRSSLKCCAGASMLLFQLLACVAASSADTYADKGAASVKPFDHYFTRRLMEPTCNPSYNWNAIGTQTCFKRKNSDPGPASGCNSKDVKVSSIATVNRPFKIDPTTGFPTPLDPAPCCNGGTGSCYKCTEGDTIEVSLSLSVVSTAASRYKVSAWFGSPWVVGSKTCTANSFNPAVTAVTDSSCCGGLQQNNAIQVSFNKIRLTCTAGDAASACVNQQLDYSFSWDNNVGESECTVQTDVLNGQSYANLNIDQPKCLDPDEAPPVPLKTIVVIPSVPSPLGLPVKVSSENGNDPCSGEVCTVQPDSNFYWLVTVPILSGRNVDYLTLQDDGLATKTEARPNAPVQWFYTKPDGTKTTLAACELNVVPSPTQFSCKTKQGTYTGGTFTFKIPAHVTTDAANGQVSNVARAIATAGSKTWYSDDVTGKLNIQSIPPVDPSLGITKIAKYVEEGSTVECPDPCTLPAGTFDFTYVITGKVLEVGSESPNGLKELRIVDISYPAGLPVGTLTCSTIPPPASGTSCACSIVGSKPTCYTTIPGGWKKDSQLVMNIAVSASPGNGQYLNTAQMSVTTGTADRTVNSGPVSHNLVTSVTPPGPNFSASKTAYKTDDGQAACGSTSATCTINGGATFFWVTRATVSTGDYGKFVITDTIAATVYNPFGNAVCRVNGAKATQKLATVDVSTRTYTCTFPPPGPTKFVTNDIVELWIPVKAPTMAPGSADLIVQNTGTIEGTADGSSTPQSPKSATASVKIPGNPTPPPVFCDAAVTKSVTKNPVYVKGKGSSQPDTTNVITTVTVAAESSCTVVQLFNKVPEGLSLTAFVTQNDNCAVVGGNEYTYVCTWYSPSPLAVFSVNTLLTVNLDPSNAPTTLTDLGVLGADSNNANNQATAKIDVLKVSPELMVTKNGPVDQMPINQPFPFFVTAGVSNDVVITELTMTEKLTGVEGAYFVEWPAGCTGTGEKPTSLDCKWTGSVIPTLLVNLKFVVVATKAGTVTNTATVSSPGAVTKSATDDAVICDATCPPPSKAKVTKTVDTGGQPYVAPGVEFTYSIVAELIQGSATSLAVFDYVDPEVTFTSIVAPSTGCSLSDHTVTCNVPPKTTITLKAKASTLGTFTNTAQVSVGGNLNTTTVDVTVWEPTCGDVTFGGSDDPFTGCPDGTYDDSFAGNSPPSIEECCNLNPEDVPTMTITKSSSSDEVSPGQQVDWTIYVTNQVGLGVTPVTAEGVQVKDTLPSGVRLDQITITGGTAADTCTTSDQQITCNLNSMPAGTVKVIRVSVTILKSNGNGRKKLTNTATVTCKVDGKENPACKDTTSDDIFVTPLPPQTVMVDIEKTATPKIGPSGTDFVFKIVVQPAEAGKVAKAVVLKDNISKDLKNVKLLTALGGKCQFDQSSYALTCTWPRLRSKQTVRIKVTGVKPGPTTNTAVVDFTGGSASSSADIMVNAEPLGSCCYGSYACYDGVTEAACKAKGGAGAVWSDWTANPPVTCSSSSFCKGACCSSGVGDCNCPYCQQTSKSECSKPNDKWVPGADCNNPTTCPSQCLSKCQACSGPGDSSCCPGLACVCSGNKFGPQYVCAQVNPFDPDNTWIYITGKTNLNSANKIVKSNLLAPIGGPCGRTAAGLQCAGPGVDCVLNSKSEVGCCRRRSTLRKVGQSCKRQEQCVGGSRCFRGFCKQTSCPAESGCRSNDFECLAQHTFDCQVFYAHTMSSFDQTV